MGRPKTLTAESIDRMIDESPTRGLYRDDLFGFEDWIKKELGPKGGMTAAVFYAIDAAYRVGYLRGTKYRKR